MHSSRFLLSPNYQPSSPSLIRPASPHSSVDSCSSQASYGVPCQPAQPTVVYISLAVVLVPIFVCIILIGCIKVFLAFYRPPAAPTGGQQVFRQGDAAGAATKGELAMTKGQLDGMKLVILAGSDGTPVMAVPRVVQEHEGSLAESGVGLERAISKQMGVTGK